MADEPLIAVFVDFENLALGVRDMKGGRFKIDLILKRLLEKGRIVVKRAYCDWSNYREDVRDFHGHGIELIDIPRSKASGKNSADIHMVVDALDLCYSKTHIDFFALLTGDSDFSPLVSKLKENDKRVLGCGVKQSTSNLLISGCDEFIYYDDLIRAHQKGGSGRERKTSKPEGEAKPRANSGSGASAKVAARPEKPERRGGAEKGGAVDRKPEAVDQLMEIIESLSQDYDQIWGSMIKQTIRRVYPSFNEAYLGYRNFAELLEHAEDEGCVELDYDERRGNYKVRLIG
ncbi:MAG: NYN domain-containing protein [Myxococcota bacterium]|nr:NYN domain-containing protein [Myxococcota bacterium]